MTRKEWMLKNHPDVVSDRFTGGVKSCPGSHRDLVGIDPSCNALCVDQPNCKDNGLTCMECWNQEIPGTKKTRPNGFRLEKVEKVAEEAELSAKEAIDRAVCDCDTCAHQDLCRFECQFRGMTKEMYKHCIEETARYNIPQLVIDMWPLHCKRYDHLTDELVQKIFDEESK